MVLSRQKIFIKNFNHYYEHGGFLWNINKMFEFKQDQNNSLSDEQIKERIIQTYLTLCPIYENKKQYVNSIFITKNSGKIIATVKTERVE